MKIKRIAVAFTVALYVLYLISCVKQEKATVQSKEEQQTETSVTGTEILATNGDTTVTVTKRETDYLCKDGTVYQHYSSQLHEIKSDSLPPEVVDSINNLLYENTASLIAIIGQDKVNVPNEETCTMPVSKLQTTEVTRCDDKVISIRENFSDKGYEERYITMMCGKLC